MSGRGHAVRRPDVPHVLVTDDVNGQSRAALAAVRALTVGGYQAVVSVATRRSVAAASRYAAGSVRLPRADQPGYAQALGDTMKSHDLLLALPSSDAALLALGGPAAALVDKSRLFDLAAEAGIAVPPGRVFESGAALADAAGALSYPAIAKAVTNDGGGFPARRLETVADAAALAPVTGPLMVQPYQAGELRAVSGVLWDGELFAICHQSCQRLWPPRAGVACAATTIQGDTDIERALVRLLSGHRGVFQAQFLGSFLLDVNPRIYGSLPLALRAGANLPAIAVELARGRAMPLVRARTGVRYRWLEGDVRHILHAARRRQMTARQTARALLPVRGAAHSIESVVDPLPGLVRLQYAFSQGRR